MPCGADGTLYCGWTNDLNKRLAAHNGGTAAKYTHPRRPVELAYYEMFETKHAAMSREVQIKRLSRQEKLELIAPVQNGEVAKILTKKKK